VHPAAGIATVLGILGALFIALRAYGAIAKPHPEILRKAMHIGMGLVTLSFPWVFATSWPVWLLAGLAVAALVGVRRIRVVRESFGEVIHGVKRESTGELLFPIAVAAVFELAQGNWVFYVVPILLLALADALAALIGVRYGKVHYSTVEGTTKSIEGSVAFFLVAFIATEVVVLLGSDMGRAETLLVALQVGIVLAMVEAVAWKGLDNLFVPLVTFAILQHGMWRSVPDLATRLAVLAALAAVIWVRRRHTTLDPSGLVAAVLVGFVTWTVGGATWLVAPMIAMLSYALLWPSIEEGEPPRHNAQAVLAVNAAALGVLYFRTRMPDVDWLYLSVASYAIQLAFIGRAGSPRPKGPRGGWTRIVTVSIVGWAIVFVPYVILYAGALAEIVRAALALPIVLVAAIVFAHRYRHVEADPWRPARWIMQGVLGIGGTLLAVAPWLWF
jgi:phytol kinase